MAQATNQHITNLSAILERGDVNAALLAVGIDPSKAAEPAPTRRQFSKWFAGIAGAVAVPAAVVVATPAVAPAAAPPVPVTTADWEAMEDEYLEIIDQICEVNDRIKIADKGFRNWERRNPWPPSPDWNDDEAAIENAKLRKECRLHACRYEHARLQCGAGRHQRRRMALQEQFNEIEGKIAAVPVRTLADIKAKARIGQINVSGLINRSLSQDLLTLTAA